MADDGVKVEGGCPNRMDPVVCHIETDDIESIKIIKDPYSLKYGPSFGGIIQLITIKPHPYDTFQIHAKLHTTLNSNPEGSGQYALLNGGGKKMYFGISGSYKNYGDYKDGNGNTVSSSFTKYNYSADVGYKSGQNQELLVSLHRNYGRDVKFPCLPMDEIMDNTTLGSVDYHIKELSRTIKKLDLKFYYSDVYHEMDNSFRPAYSTVTPPYSGLMQTVSKVDASNTGGRTEMNLITGKQELNAGFDVELAAKDGDRVNTMIMTINEIETTSKKNTNLWENAQALNSGLFADFFYRLPLYQFNSSTRFDYNKATSEDTLKVIKNGIAYFDMTNSEYMNFSVNAGIIRSLQGGHSLSLYVGRGMRSPDLTERYIKFLVVGYDNYDYLGNPRLKPEINYQTDLLLDFNLKKSGKLQLDLFASIVQDYISGEILPSSVALPKSMGAVGVKQFMNTGIARFYGFESTYNSPDYKGLNIVFSASYTYGIKNSATRNLFENHAVVGQQTVTNDAVQEIPPFEARLNANYRFYNEKMLFTLES